MGKLIYLMNVSLDGFIETAERGLEWGVIDDEIHAWFSEQSERTDAFLYGRRLYEVMNAYWPHASSDQAATPAMLEFGRIWNSKPKIVFSKTLERVDWNSRLARGDVGEELERLKAEFPGDLDVAGPMLASAFIRRGLVDEYKLVVHPVVLGSGTPFFPPLENPIRLRLTETRRFASGVVLLAYARA